MAEWKVEVVSTRDGSTSHVEVKASSAEAAREAVAMTGAGIVGGATLLRMDATPVAVLEPRTEVVQPRAEEATELLLADLRPSGLLVVPPLIGCAAWLFWTVVFFVTAIPVLVIAGIVTAFLTLFAAIRALETLVYVYRARLTLTTQRVIAKGGSMFSTQRMESPLRAVETVAMAQTFWSNMLGLASIGVSFTGGTRTQLRGVSGAAVLVEKLNRAIETQRRR